MAGRKDKKIEKIDRIRKVRFIILSLGICFISQWNVLKSNMNHGKLISFFLFFSVLFGSGGFDNGTATGRGKFQLDLTWNPFDKIEFGQTYGVISYGITDRFDLHGYISRHAGPYYTWYGGLFYQFYNSNKINLGTAIGIRKRFDESLTHLFSPQMLYTVKIKEKISIGGSIVNVYNYNSKKNFGPTLDISLGYRLPVQTNNIESITINVGGFHPVTWKPDAYFLPTYSIDINFR